MLAFFCSFLWVVEADFAGTFQQDSLPSFKVHTLVSFVFDLFVASCVLAGTTGVCGFTWLAADAGKGNEGGGNGGANGVNGAGGIEGVGRADGALFGTVALEALGGAAGVSFGEATGAGAGVALLSSQISFLLSKRQIELAPSV